MLVRLEDGRSVFVNCKNFCPRQLSVSLGGLLTDCASPSLVRLVVIPPFAHVAASVPFLFIEKDTHMTVHLSAMVSNC
jgi:hypothetical protein